MNPTNSSSSTSLRITCGFDTGRVQASCDGGTFRIGATATSSGLGTSTACRTASAGRGMTISAYRAATPSYERRAG